MAPIIIYGQAVQEARNVLRSAQISTMFDVLRTVLYSGEKPDNSYFGSAFSNLFTKWVLKLQADAEGSARAVTQINRAAAFVKQFNTGNQVDDVFAVGDALRAVGEYFELGGGGDYGTQIEAFRKGLRNKIAFNTASRARQPILDFAINEWPDLGIFKNHLLDRSTVKFMERFYGPYIGADISGTTTDSLAVLAAFNMSVLGYKDLKNNAEAAIAAGEELVPISTMVLQYHHSLMETGLALSLSSDAMDDASAIKNYNFYNFVDLGGVHPNKTIKPVLEHGNLVLERDLGGRGLVVLRDLIDIQGNPYADVEIGLLMETPRSSDIFNLKEKYGVFYHERKDQALDNYQFNHDNPSLAGVAHDMPGMNVGDDVTFNELIAMNSVELGVLASESKAFNSLLEAIKSVGDGAVRQSQVEHSQANASQATAGASQQKVVQGQAATDAQVKDSKQNDAKKNESGKPKIDLDKLQEALRLLSQVQR
ncbi:hypothetical protein [Polycladidibacter stylochi]|uniref:hypothetical protein n=1 Tax=Polycladidibacter stylochi TaxID=1807766 RepID=UPI000836A9F0|nr:hypothetical protein [Pseudovibrio stylochi]